MATNIIQVEDLERDKQILRVTGEMFKDDAILLEKISLDLRRSLGRNVTLDLADLSLLDSESAPIIKRLEREHGFEIEGMEIFLQNAINNAG